MRSKHFSLFFGMCASFLLISVTTMAQSLDVLKTPPSVLSNLTQSELNEFGSKAIDEAYTILSQVGSKTGDIGGRPNQENPDAVRNAKALLDNNALIQTARLRYGITKTTYAPTDVDDFKVSDVIVTIPANGIIVASYKLALPNRVDLKSKTILSGEIAPRITVLRWDEKKSQWLVFSHADFDTPSATLCGAASAIKPLKSRFSKDNIALAKRLLNIQFDNAMNGNPSLGATKGFQVVYASGEKSDRVNYSFSQKPKLTEIEATRSGSLLAVRYNGPGPTSFHGQAIDPSVKPRLLTFYKNEKGEWQRISAAIFSVTAKVASSVQCVMPTVK